MTTANPCIRCNATLGLKDPLPISTRKEQLRSIIGAPSSTETDAIMQSIETCHVDVLRYEEEIERVSAVLADLKEKQAAFREYITERQSLLAPVRKLPAEILMEIFAFSRGEYDLEILKDEWGNLCVGAHTLALTKVCSFWRMVAISLPNLWVRIQVDLAIPLGPQQDRIRDLLQLYITRSKNVGLDLRIEATCFQPDRCHAESVHWSRTMVQLLLLERSRWRRVAYDLLEDIYVFEYLQGLTDSYSCLEKLELGEDATYSPLIVAHHYDDVTVLDGFLSDAPNLRELKLSGTFFEESVFEELILSMPLKADQLTSVIVDGRTSYAWDNICDILPTLPSLEHFSVDFGYTPDDSDSELKDSIISITNCRSSTLKSFTMTAESLCVASAVMTSLTLPSLTDLNLTLDSVWEVDSLQLAANDRMLGLKTMLEQSSCKLQSLTLTLGDLFTTQETLDVLSRLPTLTTLSIDADCELLCTQFFAELTLPSSDQFSNSEDTGPCRFALVPHLTTLNISLLEMYSRQTSELPDPDIIVCMIESRQALGHFSLWAPARMTAESEREWAQNLRGMMGVRLRERRRGSGLRPRLTYTLSLGEL